MWTIRYMKQKPSDFRKLVDGRSLDAAIWIGYAFGSYSPSHLDQEYADRNE